MNGKSKPDPAKTRPDSLKSRPDLSKSRPDPLKSRPDLSENAVETNFRANFSVVFEVLDCQPVGSKMPPSVSVAIWLKIVWLKGFGCCGLAPSEGAGALCRAVPLDCDVVAPKEISRIGSCSRRRS